MTVRRGNSQIGQLIDLMAKLPGLGPRSARRTVLTLITRKTELMLPLAKVMKELGQAIRTCSTCGNCDVSDPCSICADPMRADDVLIVVETVSDLWALERSGVVKGRYHVLGGAISPLDGLGPEDLNIEKLLGRLKHGDNRITEIIIALNATVEGQSTTYYLNERIDSKNIVISRLARGIPVGGELDYLDDGTLLQAWQSRTRVPD